MKSNQPIVIGNWKMNPATAAEAKQIFMGIKKAAKRNSHATVVIAPPVIFIPEVARLSLGGQISLGIQNIYPLSVGAQTGETSLAMAMPYGVKYCIVGHSERRAMGETNEQVAEKIAVILKQRLTPVVCIGERERDQEGNFFLQIEAQIKSILAVVPKARYKDIVLAYEPIWAIGTGKNATVDDVIEMQLFVQKIITKHFSRSAASQVRFLYGGSVKGGNAGILYQSGVIDGFLVGGASLKVDEFAKVIVATKM